MCVCVTIFFFFIDRKTLFQHCLTCEKGGDVRRPSFPLENFISSFFLGSAGCYATAKLHFLFLFFWYLNVSVGPSENVERNVDAFYIKTLLSFILRGENCVGDVRKIYESKSSKPKPTFIHKRSYHQFSISISLPYSLLPPTALANQTKTIQTPKKVRSHSSHQ